jgi:hypothetical protein
MKEGSKRRGHSLKHLYTNLSSAFRPNISFQDIYAKICMFALIKVFVYLFEVVCEIEKGLSLPKSGVRRVAAWHHCHVSLEIQPSSNSLVLFINIFLRPFSKDEDTIQSRGLPSKSLDLVFSADCLHSSRNRSPISSYQSAALSYTSQRDLENPAC